MNTWSLALRNLLRNRRRSLTTLVAMVIGVVTILIFGGYSRNIAYSLQTGYVLRSGHLQVQRKDYFRYGTGNPAAYGIADYRRVIDVLQHDPVLAPMARVVTPTISLGGIAGNFAAGVSRTVVGTGMVVGECVLGERSGRTKAGWTLPVTNARRYKRPRPVSDFGLAKVPRSFRYV